jgi:hypothetical protein
VTTDVVQRGRDCLLGQLLDQPEQFIALHAHELSVRIVSAGHWNQQCARYCPVGGLAMVTPATQRSRDFRPSCSTESHYCHKRSVHG